MASPNRETLPLNGKGAKSEPLLESLSDTLPTLPSGRRILSPREIEVRYFVPDSVVKALTDDRPFTAIRQHYFSRSELASILKRFGVDDVVKDVGEFTSGRVRCSKGPDGSVKHELEFKGPKESVYGAPISRREFSISISEDLFDLLVPMATAGALKKRRFELDGQVRPRGGACPATAHIDITRRLGNSLKKIDPYFCTVDIELSSTTHLSALRLGDHSFPFLKECVEISTLSRKLRGDLSNSALARHGLDSDRREAISAVRDEAEHLCRLNRKLKR